MGRGWHNMLTKATLIYKNLGTMSISALMAAVPPWNGERICAPYACCVRCQSRVALSAALVIPVLISQLALQFILKVSGLARRRNKFIHYRKL